MLIPLSGAQGGIFVPLNPERPPNSFVAMRIIPALFFVAQRKGSAVISFEHTPLRRWATARFTLLLGLWMIALPCVWGQDYAITTTGGTLLLSDQAGNGDAIHMTQDGAGIKFTSFPARTYSLNGGPTLSFPVTIPNVANFDNIVLELGAGDDVAQFAAFSAVFKNLTIQGGAGNDNAFFAGDITFAANANLDLDMQNDVPNPGSDIFVLDPNTNLLLSGTGTATVKVGGYAILHGGASLETVNGNLTLEVNQQAVPTTFGNSGILLSNSTLKVGGSGLLTVKGRASAGPDGSFGVIVQSGAKIQGGTGAVSVSGMGGNYTNGSIGGVVVAFGASITSTGGDVTVLGQGASTGTGSFSTGVSVTFGGWIAAGGNGKVTVQGTGGGKSGGSNHGVYIAGGNASIFSAGGEVSVTGQGGAGGDANYGVLVQIATISAGGNGKTIVYGVGGVGSMSIGVFTLQGNASITSSSGDVSVTGLGGNFGTSYGINISFDSAITAGGLGKVTVTGTGGASSGNHNWGVYVNNVNAKITSSGGDLLVVGQGGGTGSSSQNYGVNVATGGQIAAGGNATTTVLGTGGATGGNTNIGIMVAGTNARINSNNGSVVVTGQGGGSGASVGNFGVAVQNGGLISAGGLNSVTVNGQGGATVGNSNYGVHMFGSGASITSSGGNVHIVAQGGGLGSSLDNCGVYLVNLATVGAGGNGQVQVSGTGGATAGGSNCGVTVIGGASIGSNGGDVSVTGQGGGTGTSNINIGTRLGGGGIITAGGQGKVYLTGRGGLATGSNNFGVFIQNASSMVTSSGNTVSVIAVEGGGPSGIGFVNQQGGLSTFDNGGIIYLTVNSALIGGFIKTNSSGTVFLSTYGDHISANLGTTTDVVGGPLGLSDWEMDQISAGNIRVVNNGLGNISVSAPITLPLTTNLHLTTRGQLFLNAPIHTAGGNLLVNATNGTNPAAMSTDATIGTLSFVSGDTLRFAINGTTLDAQYQQLKITGAVNLTGVELAFTGNYTVAGNETFVLVDNDGTDPVVGTFNGLPEFSTIFDFLGSGFRAYITYTGGTGNDVVLNVCKAPVFTGCVNQTVVASPGSCGVEVAYPGLTVDEQVPLGFTFSGATVRNGEGTGSGQPFNAGVTVVMLAATNDCKTSTCQFTVTVTDTQAPSITCPDNVVQNGTSGTCGSVANYALPTFSDDCPNAYVELASAANTASGSVFPGGVTTVVWRVLDAGGNSATCSFTVTVSDVEAPSITCPANIQRGTDLGQCTAAVAYVPSSVSDNCPGATVAPMSPAHASGAPFPLGNTVVVLRATDVGGNTATCTFNILVQDQERPNLTCPANIARGTDAGQCIATVTYAVPVPSDNCALAPNQPVWVSGGSGNVNNGASQTAQFPKGTTTVTWRAADAVGNTRTCTFRIIINDTERPALTCPAPINAATTPGLCSAVVTYTNPGFTDNCAPATGTATRVSGLTSGSAFPLGTSNVVFRATDAAGNTSQCTLLVVVSDQEAPTIQCPPSVTTTGSGSPCVAMVTFPLPTANDNCGGALTPVLVNGLSTGSNFPVGTTVNTWRATASNGQTAECSVSVTVQCQTAIGHKNTLANTGNWETDAPRLALYPNPARQTVWLETPDAALEILNLQLFNVSGSLIRTYPVPEGHTARLLINLADVPAGLYLLKVDLLGRQPEVLRLVVAEEGR